LAYVKDIYHDEIRSGWLVMSDNKKVWNRQLEMWAELDRICRKHEITYWAGYGTLLGAARHKGFVPWDVDFDLCMMRPDFNRFVEILADELNENVFDFRNMDYSMLKIFHKQTTLISSMSREGNPLGLPIDVFALDFAYDSSKQNFAAVTAIKEVFPALNDFPKVASVNEQGGYLFNGWDYLRRLAAEVTDENDKLAFMRLYAANLFDQSDTVNWIYDEIVQKQPFRKEWFDETIYLPFETVELPAPKMFDEVLTTYYGDWRTPVRDGKERLGFVHSADVPYEEFLRRVDANLIAKN